MNGYFISDGAPGSSQSHQIEAKKGFSTASRLIVEKRGKEWHVCSLDTKEAHRKQGLARQLIEHVEANYGPVTIQSANDRYWEAMGFTPCDDGMWRRA